MDTRTRGQRGSAVRLKPPPRLFLVTSPEVVSDPGFEARARAALSAAGPGCALQLRAHGLAGRAVWESAARLRPEARARGSELWVNDRVDVALAVRADGVQLGGGSLATEVARRLLGRGAWLGRSVHERAAAEEALAAGADVALLGHIYATPSHPGLEPLGPDVFEGSRRPIVAIGGITPERVSEVISAGAWGVAVLRGVWEARDPGAAVGRYREALSAAGNG